MEYSYTLFFHKICQLLRVEHYECDLKCNSIQQSPSQDAYIASPIREIYHILWNPKVHHRVHKSPPFVSSEPHKSSPRFHPISWWCILILSSHLRLCLPSDLITSGFPTRTVYAFLFCHIHATCPAHFIPLKFITLTVIFRGDTNFVVPHYAIGNCRTFVAMFRVTCCLIILTLLFT